MDYHITANRPSTPTILCMLKSFNPTRCADIILSLIVYSTPSYCMYMLLRFVNGLINGSSSSSSSKLQR